jgi:hypothetical protein
MTNDRNRRRLAAAAALVLVFAACWFVLDRTENRPRWVAVAGPVRAVAGSRIEFKVRLKETDPGSLIACTLHHADAARAGWGYLASSGPAQPAVAGRTYTFAFTAPESEAYAFVFAIVDLSPTGRWPEATRAASTAYIPLSRAGGPAGVSGDRRLRLYRYPTAAASARAETAPPRPARRPGVWVHPAVGALLLAAALLALKAGSRARPGAPAGVAGDRAIWLAFAIVMAAAAVVEISGIAGHVAAWGRRFAEARGLYELRQPFQKTILAATAAASLGLFFLFIRAMRRPGSHRFLWWAGIGLAAYLAVSFAGVLSFHAVDAARRLVWHGVSPFDAARGAGAAAALIAALLASRRRSGRQAI